jgi:RNA polymerase sigma factor (TIGR02999 family)
MRDITQALQALAGGDSRATDELLVVVYQELRQLAARKMASEPPGQTLQPTALVHEAYLRLVREDRQQWANRQQFYAVAAEVMRRILVDRARRKRSGKHGGDAERINLEAAEIPAAAQDELILKVHEALDTLAAEDPVKAEVVKLRFFVGLENQQSAQLLGISEKTVRRHWSFAKARLYQLMSHG